MFETLRTLIACGTLTLIAFGVLLAMPNSKLRQFLLPIVGWCVAILCGIYCISPIDILPEAFLGPFGLVDDVGAIVAGVAAVKTAMSASKESTSA